MAKKSIDWESGPLKSSKNFHSTTFPHLVPVFISLTRPCPFLRFEFFYIQLLSIIKGLLGAINGQKCPQKHEKANTELDKKVPSFRPIKHNDGKASEASDFLQSLTNEYQTYAYTSIFPTNCQHIEPIFTYFCSHLQ